VGNVGFAAPQLVGAERTLVISREEIRTQTLARRISIVGKALPKQTGQLIVPLPHSHDAIIPHP
jgi:hypothetical protein